jgi:hypothetical protein
MINKKMKTIRLEYATSEDVRNLDLGDKLVTVYENKENVFTFGGIDDEDKCTLLEKANNGSIDLILGYVNPVFKLVNEERDIRCGTPLIYHPCMKNYQEKLNLINGVVK